ncbi:MAG: hypothetical protein J2P21_03815 [Chloracidobacterium sp.]|nr:hypothetical protein [Chloracidobacterium sp.]
MKSLLVAVIALVVLPADIGRAQTRVVSDNSSFLLRLPSTIDTTGLQINYFMTGAFGGSGGPVRTKPVLHGYVIDTSYENKPAETLKIIVYCPGYGLELINVPSLAASSADGAYVRLKPLPSVQLSGRIVAPEGSARKDFKIEVSYLAFWDHEFFGIADGFVTTIKLASVDMRPDGSFSVAIPDFARDPSLDSFREKGMIRLISRESKTGNCAYTLESAERPGADAEFDVAAKYDKLVLYATPCK